jgi:hypothetical protein
MVLPPLAARSLARGMGSFLSLSSLLGLGIAVIGFYLSVRLDLPLGPTDVAFGCAVLFAVHAIGPVLRKSRGLAGLLAVIPLLGLGCSAQKPSAPLDVRVLGGSTVWLAPVRNSTETDLRFPGDNPLRSLAEMAGRISPDDRPTVMDLLRGAIRQELAQRKVTVALPEQRDRRLQSLPFEAASAATNARAGNLSGWLLLSDIRRWTTDGRAPLNARVGMRLVDIATGTATWDREIQKIVPLSGAARVDDASADAVNEIMREIFGP